MEYSYKVSVIVPVYNTEKFVRRCLDSLLEQSYHDLEVILVDDGSTDDSGEICDTYATSDRRVRVIHQENAGQGTARNTGLDAATGDLISFVDSDDYIARSLYETVAGVFDREKADIVCFRLHAGMDDDYQFPGDKDLDGSPIEVIAGIDFLRGLYETEHFDSSVLKVYKRELFNELRFPEGRTMGEDVGTVYRLAYRAERVALLRQEFYYYYQTPGSTMRGAFSLDKVKECDSFKERLQFFDRIEERKLYERALLQYEAVVLRSYYYVKKLHATEDELLKKLYGEIYLIRREIKKAESIPTVKKLIYRAAAAVPRISGYAVSRLL